MVATSLDCTAFKHPQRMLAGPHRRETATSGVLIADSDEMIRTLLGMFFSQQKIPFWLASNGHEAMSAHEQHARDVAFVLLDVNLRGCDGPLTLRHFQKTSPHVVCYFMSDDFAPYSEAQLLEMGQVGLVVKPFLWKLLAGIVQECFSHR